MLEKIRTNNQSLELKYPDTVRKRTLDRLLGTLVNIDLNE